MEIIDYKKQLKQLYSAKQGVVSEVQVPCFLYLMLNGKGDPTTSS